MGLQDVLRLCVLPNEALEALVRKGAVRDNYFNPQGLFEEVIIVSPGDSSTVNRAAVKRLVGGAKVRLLPRAFHPHLVGIRPIRCAQRICAALKCSPPHVVRSYNPLVSGWLANYIARMYEVPSIISIHTNYHCDQVLVGGLYRRDIKRFVYYLIASSLLAPKVLRGASSVVAKYGFAAQWAKRFRSDVEVLYNAVNEEFYNKSWKPTQRSNRDWRVVAIGRLEPLKGHHTLVRAMRYVQGRLLIVGAGSQERFLRKLAHQEGVANRVDFLGAIPNEHLPTLLADADVFATATSAGGVGVAMLEAMAVGLPVVVAESRFERGRELLDKGGLIVRNTPTAFAEAFRLLQLNPKLRVALGAAAKRVALEIRSEADKGEARLYERVLEMKQ